MSIKPKVTLSQDFLLHLAKLPAGVQGKVLKWAIRFQTDPTASGFNYEKIRAARDPHLRSVRIDGDWRGMVFVPPRSDLYILLYMDHHDEAYRWAENRKLTINPVTGAMQVVPVEEVSAPPASAEVTVRRAPDEMIGHQCLFAALSDAELLSLGTPADLLSRVRQITSETELDALQPVLPIEAYEGLFLVAAGDTVSQVLSARETHMDRLIDTEDFATSMETVESQSRFVVVDNDEALTTIMNAPLAQWRVFLHPLQKRLAVGDRSGPVRVLGCTGTGKTVLAMHRAKWLAEHATPAGKKVLVTTFTRNLAIDLETNDETQDFGPQALRLLRALIKPGTNDLFFVGDGHQRIYHRN